MKVGNHQKPLFRPIQRTGGISGEFDPGDRDRAIGRQRASGQRQLW